MDFQFDATTDGRPIKLVSIIDEHTRECLTSLVDRSVTADVLIDELDRLALTRGYPAVLRCDNGPELACEAMADWAGERVGLSFIPPGEPWRNGYVESFNGRVRDECLNINIFWSLAQARVGNATRQLARGPTRGRSVTLPCLYRQSQTYALLGALTVSRCHLIMIMQQALGTVDSTQTRRDTSTGSRSDPRARAPAASTTV